MENKVDREGKLNHIWLKAGLLALSFTFSSVGIADQAAGSGQTITLAGSDYCPYICLDEAGKFASLPGIHIEILKAIFPQPDYNIENVSLPWARAVQQVSLGKIDALNGAFKEDAPGLWFPESPVTHSQMCFYTQPYRNWEFKGIASLENTKALLVNGLSISEEIDHYYEQNKDKAIFIPYERYYENFPKLMQRTEPMIFIEDRYVAKHLMSKVWKQEYRVAGCLPVQQMWIPFSRNKVSSRSHIDQFNSEIPKLKANGVVNRILEKYLDM